MGQYIASHPKEAAMMTSMPIAAPPRLMMALTGPFIGLGSGLILGLFASRLGFDHGEVDGGRDEVLDGVTEDVAHEMHLLEGFGVHEIVVLAVVVQIFHFLFVERGALHFVFRGEALLGHGAGAQVAQF
jgi:hypothetical protein